MSTPASNGWETVIGLEIHVQLKTRTKMFCRCELEYGGGENTHTCPVCLAHPGTLPVPNERAIEMLRELGDPHDPQTEMGPVANQPQYEKVLGYLDTARAEGAEDVGVGVMLAGRGAFRHAPRR